MVENVILAECSISGFTTDSATVPATTPLIAGKSYTVTWDGTPYTCIAYDMPIGVDQDGTPISSTFLGNREGVEWLMGGQVGAMPEIVEPFSLNYVTAEMAGSTTDIINISCAGAMLGTCPEDTHRVGIRLLVDEDDPAILAETTYEGFESGVIEIVPAPCALTVGEMYTVIWDGVAHECECVSNDGLPLITDIVTDESGEIPLSGTFAIMYYPPEVIEAEFGAMGMIGYDLSSEAMFDAATSHTVAIYQVVEEEPEDPEDPNEPENPDEPDEPGDTEEGIILKDRKGNDKAYYGIETVTFDTTTEGKQQVYSKGVAVENLEIVPDFTDGDMPLSAGDDTLVKSAVIQKPADLSPENVKRGKSIAGIDGDFIGDTEELVIGEAEGETPLNFAEVDQMIFTPSTEDKVFSQVTVKKPEMLLPENIAEDVEIAGVVGTFKGGGLEETMRYFQCHVDPTAGTITLYKIYYDLIYADTGNYDVIIPDTIGGLDVVISATS